MATVLQFKRSVVEGAIPSSGALADGELAINTVDGKVFLKKSDNTVVPVSDWTRAIYTASTTDANQIVDTFSVTKVRSVKYVIQATRGSQYHTTEVMMIHDGTQVYMTEYATVYTGASPLITLDSDISGGYVRLLVTPAMTNTTVRTARFDTLV
jgi:hypothetical protein